MNFKNFEKISENEASFVAFAPLEEAIDVAPIIIYNQSTIEFPGMVMFTVEDTGLLSKILNPGLESFQVKKEDYKNMINAIESEKENVIFIEKHLSPKGMIRINLSLIKDRMFYLKEFENSILINDILFTTSSSEFHGSGMFSGRSSVVFVNEKVFSDIKSFVKA